jgi:LPXTG-motif cell wall-anchored protein
MLRSGISEATPVVSNAPGGRTENLRQDTAVFWRCKPCGKTRIPPGPEFWGYHLRRFMPSARRLLTLGGAAFVGLAATALLAAPASAHTATVAIDQKCDHGTGKIEVTFTVSNDYPKDATLSNVVSSPALTKIVNGATVDKKKGDKDGTLSETVQVEPGTTVKLGVTATWKEQPKDFVYKVPAQSLDTKDNCKPECPPSVEPKGGGPKPQPSCPPSESPSPSPSGGTGGGEGSPTPSKSNTSPSLPVTGAQTGLYAGGAMVLLGAGAGLFFVARRRRIKFEA